MSATSGYFKIYRRVFKLKLSADELSLYTILLSHDFNPDHPGTVHPTFSDIKDHIKMSRELISDNLWCLHDMGLITIRQTVLGNGRVKFEYYLPNIDEFDTAYFDSIIERIPRARKFKKARRDERTKRREGQRGNSKIRLVVSHD